MNDAEWIDSILADGWYVQEGDCRETLPGLPEGCVDAVVTDPPYGLSDEPDVGRLLTMWLNGEEYQHRSKKGFCGAEWDKFVPGPVYWKAVYRILKPGGHLLCFAGTRTWDLMSLALRLAGFENRNTLAQMIGPSAMAWMYSQGMGRSHMLKPTFEPILVFRKPLEKGNSIQRQMEQTQTGTLNFSACMLPRGTDDRSGWHETGADGSEGFGEGQSFKIRAMSAEEIKKRCGAARFPPNSLVVGEEMLQAIGLMSGNDPAKFFPVFYCPKPSRHEKEAGCEEAGLPLRILKRMNDGGLSREKRWAPIEVRNNHETVKPIRLCEWLLRLACPNPEGVILDPFCGSGSVGCAARKQGFRFLGCELKSEYADIARARIRYWEVKSQCEKL